MSYDISVLIPCKNEDGSDGWHSINSHNYTYNVGKMLYVAFQSTGGDWQSFHDPGDGPKLCSVAIPELEAAIKELKDNYDRYSEYNPANGWGNIGGAIEFLEKILQDCKRFPQGRVGFG